MPFTTGELSGFGNRNIAGEVVGAGDGATTVFNFQVAKKTIYQSTFVLYYTVGTANFQATTDSAGNITGTHITSGSIDEAGSATVTFSTAPDNSTNLTSDYTAKGFLQKLKEFITTSQFTETLGTGNGVTVTFSGTLANTDLSKGQVRIKFRIQGQTFYVYDDGLGKWNHAHIVSSSLDYTTGAWSITFAIAPDNGIDINTLYAKGVEGQDWLLITDEKTKTNGGADAFPSDDFRQMVFKNSGVSYEESIFIGFRETRDIGLNFYSINLNVYWTFSDGGDWNQNAGGSLGHGKTGYDATRNHYIDHPSVSLNDDTIIYWISATKNRVTAILRITGTLYVGFYLGWVERFATPTEYPFPLIAIGSHYGFNNFTDTGSAHTSIIFPASGGNNVMALRPDKSWTRNGVGVDELKFLPTGDFTQPSGQEMDTNALGQVDRWPVIIINQTTKETYFALEGVYYFPSTEVQSEANITIGSDTYYIFQNVHRISFKDFLGIQSTI